VSGKITPGWIAGLDQDLAEANRRLDELLATVRSQAREAGQAQASANLGLMVTLLPGDLAQSYLFAVLHRLAFRDGEGTRCSDPQCGPEACPEHPLHAGGEHTYEMHHHPVDHAGSGPCQCIG